MGLMRVLPFAKYLLREHVTPGAVAIDMTAGNGHDTLFLAELVEATGHVYAFDVQAAAVEATRAELGALTNLYTPAAYKSALVRGLVRRALTRLREAAA